MNTQPAKVLEPAGRFAPRAPTTTIRLASICFPWFLARKPWRPRLVAHGDAAAAPYLWTGGFLLGTEFAPRLWKPALQGAEGDLIGPIREMADPHANLDAAAVAKVARAVVAIRAHFMPRRAKTFR